MGNYHSANNVYNYVGLGACTLLTLFYCGTLTRALTGSKYKLIVAISAMLMIYNLCWLGTFILAKWRPDSDTTY